MKRIVFIFLLFGCLPRLAAQSVQVNAKMDSLQILIGEQTGITLEVSADAGRTIILPLFADTIVSGVEVVETQKPDSEFLNNGNRLVIKQKYIITSFDSALYYLPPMQVKVDDEMYESNPLALKVYSFPVDTLHPDEFFGPKDILNPPFVWSDWYLTIAFSVLLFPMGFLLYYLLKRMMDNQPIIRKVKVEPKRPAHEVALQELERIKEEKAWQKGMQKEYYTDLTEALRNYLQGRFGFNAMEMTSSEIIDKLLEVKDETALAELRGLFQTSDLVKFAKYVPLINESDANLLHAVQFVNNTKEQVDPNAKPEPTEITVIEKRPLRSKLLLGTAVVLIAIFMVIALVYIGYELYYYVS